MKDIKQRNKKVIGKFKDELQGISIGLRLMMYMKERIFEVDEEGEEKVVAESSTTIEKMEDRKTAKGVKRAVKDQHLRHHYKDTLMSLGKCTVS